MEKIKAYYQTSGRVSVDFVVIHWINGDLNSCIRTFTDGARQASAHYGVEDGRLVNFVDDADTAWALGNWDANQRSISVEHSAQPGRPATDATYETSIGLIAGLMVKHGLTPSLDTIRPHNHFSATQCPGTMDLQRIVDGVKARLQVRPQSIEGIIMAMSSEQQDHLYSMVQDLWWQNCSVEGRAALDQRTGDAVLERPIPREGAGAAIPGPTSLRAVVASTDDHTIRLLNK